MDVYTLLYLKWRTNQDLLYSVGTLLNVMWQPGSGLGRFGVEWMCEHVWLSPFYCPPGTTTTLLTDYTPVQNKNFKTDKQVHVVNLSWSKLLRKLNPRKSCMLRPCQEGRLRGMWIKEKRNRDQEGRRNTKMLQLIRNGCWFPVWVGCLLHWSRGTTVSQNCLLGERNGESFYPFALFRLLCSVGQDVSHSSWTPRLSQDGLGAGECPSTGSDMASLL